MLLLPLLLLAVIVPGGDNEDAFQGPTSYHVIQILTFANSTWVQRQASGWLDDFQIHGWDSDSGTAIFLKPWSKGNFSDEELTELEDLFQAYFIGFTKEVQDYVSKAQIECEHSPLLRGDSQWFCSLLVKAITLLDLGPVLPLYPTACTHFSRVVSNSDSTPPTTPRPFPITFFLVCFLVTLSLFSLYPDPFVIQCTGGCELRSGKSTGSFLRGALGGLDFASIKNHSCAPAPEGGSRAQQFCALFSQYKGIWGIIETLLSETCPRFLLGVLDAGKAELQRQVKLEVWLSSDPSPGPGRLLLVCHVSGFYPKPVWVMWMRGEQKQSGTQQGDTVPNADGTWYLRVTLDVTAGEETGLSCRVKHSSLGDQDIIVYWGE
ncbi:hypothetical protein EI555_001974 [Monodon monoceros]|uniref:Ig-like domain-containing protein n=1 Tax=Monodon monoceros TaxID=40151 RepID=A0A4U1FF49_MONMO|nr:hypothetical protein EI555_001974 [Monodon monoceros]